MMTMLMVRCLLTVTEKVTSHHFPLNGEPVESHLGAGNRVSQAHKFTHDRIPSGKHKNYGKSPFSMGKSIGNLT